MLSTFLKKKDLQKIPLLLTFLILLLLILLLFKVNQYTPFEKICRDYLKTQYAQNTINLHFTMAHPSSFDLTEENATLPPYCPEDAATVRAEIQSWEKKFASISPRKITTKEEYLLSLLRKQWALSEALANYPYYENPLSPYSGQQTVLLTLFSEYSFYEAKDIDDYLSLLEQLPAYLDSLLEAMEKKSAKNLSPGKEVLLRSATDCASYFSIEEILSENHFLQEAFARHLKEYAADHSLTDQQIHDYKKRHNQLLKDALFPAYKKLSQRLCALADTAPVSRGLASFEKGKDYYTLLFQAKTGSEKTPQEMKQLLLAELSTTMNACLSSLQKHPLFTGSDLEKQIEDAFPLTDFSDMLVYLQGRTSKDFPLLSSDLCSRMQTDLFEISPSLQSSSAPAFYLLPPIDAYESNVIYTNPGSTNTCYENFTTLAHEGFPGHLYQTVYSYDNWEPEVEAPLRSLFSHPGFQEGYALYTELLSYEYAAELFEQKSMTEAADYIRYQKEDQKLQLCLLTLLEILIHDENADLTRITDTLKNFNITDEESIRNLYNYIVSEPGCYTKYFASYLEIMSLKKEATTLWGDKYSDLRFHKFLLDYGPADFSSLRDMLYK